MRTQMVLVQLGLWTLVLLFSLTGATCGGNPNPNPNPNPVPVAALDIGPGLGASMVNATTLSTAIPLVNTGGADAENVQVTAMTLAGGTLTSPASLPIGVGTLPTAGSAVLNAQFTGTFSPSGSNVLTVQGTYSDGTGDLPSRCRAVPRDRPAGPHVPGRRK